MFLIKKDKKPIKIHKKNKKIRKNNTNLYKSKSIFFNYENSKRSEKILSKL